MPEISRISSNPTVLDLPCFGDWQTVSLLGRGRWSRVYRARPVLSPDCAHADYAVKAADTDTEEVEGLARQLLLREASISRAVSHPNLTCILTSQLSRPPFYLVMPYIEGRTLAEELRELRALSVPEALWITRQTADAARALHRIGWIHGDVKPTNLHVSSEGHVTMLDLGLARRIGSTDGPETLTGTLDYLAPEAFSSIVELGPACDTYSLGVMLFQMLTSHLPFDSNDAAELAYVHQHQTPPDPRQYNSGLPLSVVRLVNGMLAKQPSQRPSTDALLNELIRLEIATFQNRTAA